MPKIRFDFLVMETFDRILGATAFMDTVDRAIPDVERQEREALKRLGEERQWEMGDYYVEHQILDEKFGRWVPTLAAYSLVLLLHSAVETQLDGLAERIGGIRSSSFTLKDIKGRGIERAALFLKRTSSLDVKQDPAWRHLQNLQDLRNAIAHSSGKWTGTAAERTRLLQTYPGKLRFPDEDYPSRPEMWISMDLCRDFVVEIEGFFKRTFKATGLPDKGMQIEDSTKLPG